MKHFIIITKLPANHCAHLSNSCRAVGAVLSQGSASVTTEATPAPVQQGWHSGRQREDLRRFQGNGSPPSTDCWVRRVNRHCPVRHQATEGKAKEKAKAVPPPEELLQGCRADKPFTSLQGYFRLLSQQEVVQATPMVMTEEALSFVQEERRCFLGQRCCSHSHQKL